MEKCQSNYDCDSRLRDLLINKILIVSAIAAVTAFASTQIRAMYIGWTYRDILNLLIVTSIVILAIKRKKIKTNHKALSIITLFSAGSITGVYYLGMLGGSVFIFPAAAVIVAVFYSYRTTLIFIVSYLLLCCIVAIRFCSGITMPALNAEFLTTSYSHWVVYIICIALFFSIMCVTIHNYRKTMRIMIEKISRQRNELAEKNQELMDASNSIKILSGLLPICSSCKKIRDDKGYWNQLESYIKDHSEADFSHGICPECLKSLYPEQYNILKNRNKEKANRETESLTYNRKNRQCQEN
ncbi:hypothetical protein [Desulfamplus magnetovallimortis]|nr:hypothetical protein [Desulfamplus magnetovallimortis]